MFVIPGMCDSAVVECSLDATMVVFIAKAGNQKYDDAAGKYRLECRSWTQEI